MELILEVLLTLFGDFLAGFLSAVFDERRPATAGWQAARLVGYVIIGFIAAGLTIVIYPQHVLSSPAAQRAWLLVSPLAAALFAFIYFWIRAPRERRGWPMAHAAVLAATFTATRFIFLNAS